MMQYRLRFVLTAAGLLLSGLFSALRAEDYAITTFAGAANVTSGADGTPGSFNNPYAVAIDAAKNVYVADTLNHTVRKITPARVVSTLAGSAGLIGSANGAGSAARFNFPAGIGVDSAGNVYVSEVTNSTIRKISPDGNVSTLAGAAGQLGSSDGAGASARFFLPRGLAVDSAGNVYVADGGNHTIRKIAPDGTVSTFAGTAQQPGFVNGTGAGARFSVPFGVAVDAAGNVYVADSGNNAIRRITPAGVVTTVAGQSGVSGAVDGASSVARFNEPRGVAVDSAGNLFVVDYGNSVIRHIATNGAVSTIAGTAGVVGEVDSVGAAAKLYSPTGIVADNTTIYIADTTNNLIRRGQPASAAPLPVITLQPFDQEVAVGQPVSFSVAATGTNLTYQWLRNGVAIDGATGATYSIPAATLGSDASYRARITAAGGVSVDSAPGNLTVLAVGTGPIAITARPISQNVATGQSVTLSVTATGSGLTYQWLKDGGVIAGATSASYTITNAQTANAGNYTVRITSGGTTETATARLTVGGQAGSGIAITTQPVSQAVNPGQSVTFTVSASGTGLSYQWLKNDSAITGANAATYTIASVQASDAGSYSVRVSGGGQNVLSNSAVLTVNTPGPVGPTARLSNLSVRTNLAAGGNLIVGFFVDGGSRDVLVRAAGPGLAALGLGGTMADPRLELFSGTTSVFSNEDWPASLAPVFQSVAAFPFPAGSRDAAFQQAISGGASVHARGTGAGIVLVEAYDTGSGNSPRMTNLSARNRVGTGDDILIAGFAITGTGTKRLLIRAAGPALAALGVSGTLNDPKVEVFRGSTVVASNDNWEASLAATFTSVAAFAFPAGSRDAAMIVTLDANQSYTVQVSGADGGTGEGLIEVYELP